MGTWLLHTPAHTGPHPPAAQVQGTRWGGGGGGGARPQGVLAARVHTLTCLPAVPPRLVTWLMMHVVPAAQRTAAQRLRQRASPPCRSGSGRRGEIGISPCLCDTI